VQQQLGFIIICRTL